LCVVVPQRHALAGRRKVRFADTLDFEQVGLPVNSAAQVLMQQVAGGLGRAMRHRVIVTNFEAALRVVSAGLAISVVPREVAEPVTSSYGLKLLTLDEEWAERRFLICFRNAQALTPSGQLLLDYLSKAGSSP